MTRPVQGIIPGWTARVGSLPKAAKAQERVDAYDAALVILARADRGQIAWWWGSHQVGDSYGALCYVCNNLMASWPRQDAMPDWARESVDRHRAMHAPKVREYLEALNGGLDRLEGRNRGV